MMLKMQIDYLNNLFFQWSGKQPLNIVPLPASGSERRYFRLKHHEISAIGAWHPVREETVAFLYFSRHFKSHGLHVPEILGQDEEHQVYLLEDLGDTSLLSLVASSNLHTAISDDLKILYRKVLTGLVRFQVTTAEDLDYSFCYPSSIFDERSMLWDLHYFKYYFLKLHAAFHEEKLEDDFITLIRYLGKADPSYFMYRDFQARNILIREGQPYFIDYQGGRKGPLQYDVASLLFQVKARLPFDFRNELLEYYLTELNKVIAVDKRQFLEYYYGFVLIRLLQVLGAYGYRGLIERKPHFLSSIPYAVESLTWWLENVRLNIEIPELIRTLEIISALDRYKEDRFKSSQGALTITINSFSYRQGIPADYSGHGEGFVFDCRAMPNPGREERYREYNGRDQIIIDFFKDQPEVDAFLAEVKKLVSSSVDKYLDRKFNRLTVNFGCTGGQHRSVYCAESLASYIRIKYPEVEIILSHTVLDKP